MDGLPSKSTPGPRVFFGRLAVGHTVNKLWDMAFDYGLYPFVIYLFGLVCGFVIMAFISFIICWLLMMFYDWSKKDWLGIEAIKDLKQYNGPSRTGKWLSWVLRKSDIVACLFLSIQFDPFIVTVYLRRGRFGGMNRIDWRNFMLSWLIGNAYWSVVCFTGVSALVWIWRWVNTLV